MIAPKKEVQRQWPLWLRGLLMIVALAAVAAVIAWLFVRVVPANSRAVALRTILVGVIANVCCALVGTYLVLRRMSLLGDAISHAVLPGIALAVIFTGSVQGWPILAGAMLVGMLTAVSAQGLQHFGGVSEDSSLGVVYTSLFALGVIMLQIWNPHGHIDVDCVLFGAIENAGASPPVRWLGLLWPPAVLKLLPVLGIVLAMIVVAWKELQLVAFDPALARAMGMPATAIHLLLMGVVAMVTVSSFESVGSILVVPMLVAPAATARLLVDRLSTTLLVAALAAAIAAALGYISAFAWKTNAAGMMAVLFSPRYGLASRWLRNLFLAVQIAAEDIVARFYRAEERGTALPAADGPSNWLVSLLAELRVRRKGWLTTQDGHPQLTNRGRQHAQSIVRAHRLWESYLATHFELAADHLHAPAERMEHFLDAELQQQLADELAGKALDPHGSPIPPRAEE
jgi:manganese/zinc/iron transport system permease protein